MSSIHVASAANEVAQALPSTATVTVSKHGIQAVETLSLDAQNATDQLINFTRTFSGLEVLTNPYLRYRLKTKVKYADTTKHQYVNSPESLREWKKHIRPTSNPIANAASSINLTINNASLSINPKDHHRLISTTYPDEPDVANQRAHYGLNQLDQYADPHRRTFQVDSGHDDIEKQHNSNALRETYPSKAYCKLTKADGSTQFTLIQEDDFKILVNVTVTTETTALTMVPIFVKSAGGSATADAIGQVRLASGTPAGTYFLPILNNDYDPTADPTVDDVLLVTAFKENMSLFKSKSGAFGIEPVSVHMPSMKFDTTRFDFVTNAGNLADVPLLQEWIFTHDIYQPLSHPYFRDNKMRDNTLVNVRYFDCDINISKYDACLEVGRLGSFVTNSNVGLGYETSLLLANDLDLQSALPRYKGVTPQLIFDLVTPSVPLPTISDKVIQTFHAIQSESLPADNEIISLNSGNIQLSQVPDKIYVFCRSSKMDSELSQRPVWTPTRLATVTNLRIRTPQNSAFLINMDQESLYQMSCRNGSKQSRDSFMSSLGSLVCIDPEKDLGGYTNGVLVPFTFEVVVDAVEPLSDLAPDDGGSIVGGSDLKREMGMQSTTAYKNGELWTMYVVCELQGHLYLMADGTGKQTKSNLTVTEVADAVADGLHHPTTFPGGRVGKMDAGLLGEIGKASGVDDSGVRDALRA